MTRGRKEEGGGKRTEEGREEREETGGEGRERTDLRRGGRDNDNGGRMKEREGDQTKGPESKIM